MNFIKQLVLGLVLAACVIPVYADAVVEGAEAFDKGDYPVAARSFETALAANGPSAGLYFNLGQAQARDGQKAAAILSFRRAILLDPKMTDARMALSEAERSQGIPAGKGSWLDVVSERASLPVLIGAGATLLWLGAFWGLFGVFRKGPKFGTLAGAFCVLVLGGAIFATACLADPKLTQRNDGVFAEGASLLSAPADKSKVLTRLPAGASVRILQQSGEWTFCQAPAGEQGWAPTKSLIPLIPPTT